MTASPAPAPQPDEGEDPRVRFFTQVNEHARESGKRVPWADRVRMIHEHFPSTISLSWRQALNQPDTLAQILRDVLRLDQADPSRSGPRPAPEYRKGVDTLRRMAGQEYSTLPFHEAFQALAHGYSMSHLAQKTGLSRSHAHRLLRGEREAGTEEMLAIAKAFGKQPWYFAEFRLDFIMSSIGSRLAQAPEATVPLYRKLLGAP